jgi:hypothetical protein
MDISGGTQNDLRQRNGERRTIWIVLIVASGIGFSFFFACATPFAALATLAALKIERRDMVAIVGLVWFANQVIGYSILGYPWTLDSVAWGTAIGIAGFLALFVAMLLSPIRSGRLAISLPFIGAFATYEMSLYVAGFVLPGGDGAFTAAIVEHVFAINFIALIALLAVYQLALAIGLLPRGDGPRWMASIPL